MEVYRGVWLRDRKLCLILASLGWIHEGLPGGFRHDRTYKLLLLPPINFQQYVRIIAPS